MHCHVVVVAAVKPLRVRLHKTVVKMTQHFIFIEIKLLSNLTSLNHALDQENNYTDEGQTNNKPGSTVRSTGFTTRPALEASLDLV